MKRKFCPKCKSTDIEIESNMADALIKSHTIYACKDCGFEANTFPEIGKKTKKIKIKK